MSRRVLVLGLLPIVLLTACGQSKSGGAASSAALPPDRATTLTAAASPAASAARRTATSATRGSPSAGATHVRLPATFVLRSGGSLDPPTVSSPAFLAIELTVVSADARDHVVVLRTPIARSLSVKAGGRRSLLLAGLRAGRYQLDVDGVPRGALIVGGEPGP